MDPGDRRTERAKDKPGRRTDARMLVAFAKPFRYQACSSLGFCDLSWVSETRHQLRSPGGGRCHAIPTDAHRSSHRFDQCVDYSMYEQ